MKQSILVAIVGALLTTAAEAHPRHGHPGPGPRPRPPVVRPAPRPPVVVRPGHPHRRPPVVRPGRPHRPIVIIPRRHPWGRVMPAPMHGFEYLGYTALGQYTDVDNVYLSGYCPSSLNAPLRAIKIEVLENDANIDSLRVRYENGAWDELPVRNYFAQNSSSQWLDLIGGARCVDEIQVVGDTNGGYNQALVRFYGLR